MEKERNLFRSFSYIYSATGQKLAMTANGSSTYYRGGVMVYNGDELAYMFHPDGVVRKTNSSYIYQYNLPDHVGSTRVVLAATGASSLTEVQRTDYYPFGTPYGLYDNLGANKYLFGGKELQDGVVNGKPVELYDFHARFYDPFIARWMRQDPMRQFASPYTYCGNNPVSYIDPDGAYAYRMDSSGFAMLLRDEHGNPIGSPYYDELSSHNGRMLIRLHDRGLLSGLTQSRSNYLDSERKQNGHYATSYSRSDVFNLYSFVTACTNVEWGLEGYMTGPGVKYFIGTTHENGNVRGFSDMEGNSESALVFDMHSHPDRGHAAGQQEASDGDRRYFKKRAIRLHLNGKISAHEGINPTDYQSIPKHYIYHTRSGNLYEYTPDGTTFDRVIGNPEDFHSIVK